MPIFASIDKRLFPITKNNPKKKMIYGAWVACEAFYRALLKYGTFDEYHFFVDSFSEASSLKRSMGYFNFNVNRIRIIQMKEIQNYLQKAEDVIFFTSNTNLSILASLRFKYAKKYFPICGIAFQTVSYPSLIKEHFLDNMLSDLHRFDSIICSSRSVCKSIINLNRSITKYFQNTFNAALRYNGRLDCLPFGIDIRDDIRINKHGARKQLGLPQNKVVILYFGRFSVYDKADLYPLLVAFREILSRQKNTVLLLAGMDAYGGYGVKLKKFAMDMGLSHSVKFIFNVRDKNVVYSASDIFISPSDNIQESFGLTILEAMAFSLPVVASDWNGYKDLIVHNKTGFKIPTYWAKCCGNSSVYSWKRDHLYVAQSVCVDVQKTIEYLNILVRNRNLRLEFGNNAKDEIVKKYDWDILMPSYEKLWQRLLISAKRYRIGKIRNKSFIHDYFGSFWHYPTKILGAKDRVYISKMGLLLLETKKLPFSIYEELQDILSVNTIFMILCFLFEKKTYAAIGEIEDYTISFCGNLSKSIIRYNIMWLLKKGLLMIEE